MFKTMCLITLCGVLSVAQPQFSTAWVVGIVMWSALLLCELWEFRTQDQLERKTKWNRM